MVTSPPTGSVWFPHTFMDIISLSFLSFWLFPSHCCLYNGGSFQIWHTHAPKTTNSSLIKTFLYRCLLCHKLYTQIWCHWGAKPLWKTTTHFILYPPFLSFPWGLCNQSSVWSCGDVALVCVLAWCVFLSRCFEIWKRVSPHPSLPQFKPEMPQRFQTSEG